MEPIKDASHLFEHERLVIMPSGPATASANSRSRRLNRCRGIATAMSRIRSTSSRAPQALPARTQGGGAARPRRYLFSPTAPPAPRHQCWGSLGNLPRASGYRRVRLRSARVARQRGRAGTVCDSPGRLPARRDHHGVFRALDEFNHRARDGGLPSRHAMASSADDAC
jgi:hypothetical protein